MTSARRSGPTSTRGAADRALWLLTVGFALVLYCIPLWDCDVWFHLEHGRWIVQHARIPRTDLFTWGSLGEPYLDQHWGFQILVFGLYGAGGIALVAFAKAAIGAASVAAAMASRPPATPPSLVALGWLLPIQVHAIRNHVRPEIVTLLAVALTLQVLHAARERPRLLWLLPPLQVIAINCHAVAIVNLGVMGAYGIDRAFSRWRGLPQARRGPGWRLEWGMFAAMALAGLLSPFGAEGLRFPLLLLGKISVDQEFWSALSYELASPLEYLTPERLDFFVAIFFVQILLGAVSFALVWRDRRFDLYRLLLFAIFTQLALTSQRNLNLMAVVTGAVTLGNLADWTAARPRLDARLRSRTCEGAVALLLLALVVAVVSGCWQRVTGARHGFGIGERAHAYVHGPARFAARDGMPARAFVADFSQGSVYGFHGAPERLPFLDGRLEHPRRETLETYLRVMERLADRGAMARGDRSFVAELAPEARSDEDWPAILLDAFGTRPQILGLLGNPDWRLVFADASGAVFVSRGLAERLRLPAVSPAPLAGRRATVR